LIDQRCLAVIDVRYDGDITNFIHWRVLSPEQEGGVSYEGSQSSQPMSGTTRS
jgi:hypothetical protein